MDQQQLFESIPRHKLASLSQEEMLDFIDGQQSIIKQFKKHIESLEAHHEELKQKNFCIEEQYITIRGKFFGKSSEKQPSREDQRRHQEKNKKKSKKKKVQLPSQRYPDLPLIEKEVTFTEPQSCTCCSGELEDSGLCETSEYLHKIPAQYLVIRMRRHKYRCRSCQGALVTVPLPPRITEGGGYSDDMAIDTAMSKYCDLIPIERQAKIAEREGVKDLAPNSLINLTHYLAWFVEGAYELLKAEFLASRLCHADETPHRMLEGDKTSSWYLWGFSTEKTCYLEAKDTRSGDVAIDLLKQSRCRYLVTDKFSGYDRAVKEVNRQRQGQEIAPIINLLCNAHARRKFKEAENSEPEKAEYYIKIYGKIYRLQGMLENKKKFQVQKIRRFQKKLFEEMRTQSMEDVYGYSSKSQLGKAFRYFLKNYEGLTSFMETKELPIDNNAQERLLRNPVVGRKTWYGTHSKKGAKTASILFSLVESCKLNKVNPREYFKKLVEDLHQGKKPYTPATYAETMI